MFKLNDSVFIISNGSRIEELTVIGIENAVKYYEGIGS